MTLSWGEGPLLLLLALAKPNSLIQLALLCCDFNELYWEMDYEQLLPSDNTNI